VAWRISFFDLGTLLEKLYIYIYTHIYIYIYVYKQTNAHRSRIMRWHCLNNNCREVYIAVLLIR